jgi:thymidylate kinase
MIYFFGPDGTGKTTHAELTSLYLKRMGYRVWRANVKQHHTLSYLLLKLLNRKNPEGQVMNYCGFGGELERRIKAQWKILEVISLFPAVIYRVLLPLFLGYVVICDRYVLDTLVALSYFLKEPKLVSGTSAKMLVKLIPKDSLLIYFDADTDVILRRKRDEPLTEQLIEYYKKAYGVLMKWLGLKTITIDTSVAQVEEVQKNILRFIRSGLQCG